MVIRVREVLREECNEYPLPNSELIVLLDPSPTPNLCLVTVQVQERAPDIHYPPLYMAHEAWDDVH